MKLFVMPAVLALALMVAACSGNPGQQAQRHTQCRNAFEDRAFFGTKELHRDEMRSCDGILWIVGSHLKFRLSPSNSTSLQIAYLSIDTDLIKPMPEGGRYPGERIDIEAYFAPPGGMAKARSNRLASIQADATTESIFGFDMLRGGEFAENKVPIVLWEKGGDFAECILSTTGSAASIDDFCTANSLLGGVLVVRYPISREMLSAGHMRDIRVLEVVGELITDP